MKPGDPPSENIIPTGCKIQLYPLMWYDDVPPIPILDVRFMLQSIFLMSKLLERPVLFALLWIVAAKLALC